MKKYMALFMVLFLFCGVLGLTGCGIGKKAEEKAAEALAEKALKDKGMDVDVKGDSMVIKGADGQEVNIGGGKWPDSELGRSIPKFEKGRIDGTVETEKSLMITVYGVEKKDAVAYIEKNKPSFPLENVNMSGDGMVTWAGANDAGLKLMLTHTDDSFNISLVKEKEKTP